MEINDQLTEIIDKLAPVNGWIMKGPVLVPVFAVMRLNLFYQGESTNEVIRFHTQPIPYSTDSAMSPFCKRDSDVVGRFCFKPSPGPFAQPLWR